MAADYNTLKTDIERDFFRNNQQRTTQVKDASSLAIGCGPFSGAVKLSTSHKAFAFKNKRALPPLSKALSVDGIWTPHQE